MRLLSPRGLSQVYVYANKTMAEGRLLHSINLDKRRHFCSHHDKEWWRMCGSGVCCRQRGAKAPARWPDLGHNQKPVVEVLG